MEKMILHPFWKKDHPGALRHPSAGGELLRRPAFADATARLPLLFSSAHSAAVRKDGE